MHLGFALFQFKHSKAKILVGGELSEGIIRESKTFIEAREISLRGNIASVEGSHGNHFERPTEVSTRLLYSDRNLSRKTRGKTCLKIAEDMRVVFQV